MSKTCVGRIFVCKSCGFGHIIPYETLSDNTDEKITVKIECPYIHSCYNYEREDFKFWEGSVLTYFLNLVYPKKS